MDQYHALVHKYARAAAIDFEQGDRAEAENNLRQLESASIEVVGLLDELIMILEKDSANLQPV